MPSALLHFQVPFSSSVHFIPSFLPNPSVLFCRHVPTCTLNFTYLNRKIFRRFAPFIMREEDGNNMFSRYRIISKFRINACTRANLLFLFCPCKINDNFLIIFRRLMDRNMTRLYVFPTNLYPRVNATTNEAKARCIPCFRI